MPLIVYACCISGAPAYWDTGEAQTVPWIFGIMHPTGFPLYTIAAGVFQHLVPFGTVAWRAGLFSALAMSASAWIVARLVRTLNGDPWMACAAAWLFAFGWVAWTRGTRAEVHSLALCFALAALLYAVRFLLETRPRDAVLAALFFGLGTATHPIVALIAPALLIVITERLRAFNARLVGAVALALAVGLAFYAYLPLRSAIVTRAHLDPTRSIGLPAGQAFWDNDHPSSRGGFMREINGSDFGAGGALARIGQIQTYKSAVPGYLDTLLDEVTPLGVIFAIAGFVALGRRPDAAAVVMLAAFIFPTAFSMTYTIEADPKRYELIGFAVACACAGIGATWLLRAIRAPLSASVLTACAAGALLLTINRDVFGQRTDSGAQAVIAAVLKNTPNDAIVLSPWLDATPLAYAAYVERRLGRRIVVSTWLSEQTHRVPRWTKTRPVFVVGHLFGRVRGFSTVKIAEDPYVYRLVRLQERSRSRSR